MHRRNRTAFYTLDGTSALLKIYTRLVALELVLKDTDSQNWKSKHDVIAMLLARNDATLTQLATALQQALNALRCSDIKGNSAPVRAGMYPDLRYLRHEGDFPGETKDADLNSALQALDTLLAELRRQGVQP